MHEQGSARRPRRVRGTSLIEVLIAMAILTILMVGILQMYFLSLMVSQGSAARTQMTYKAQQVVEQIRYLQWLQTNSFIDAATSLSVSSGISAPLVSTGEIDLPYSSSESNWDFWGPTGNNVMERENGPYRISYTIADGGASWIVTVTASPQDPKTAVKDSQLFLGVGGASGTLSKRIDYVAQIPR